MMHMIVLHLLSCYCLICPWFSFFLLLLSFGQVKTFLYLHLISFCGLVVISSSGGVLVYTVYLYHSPPQQYAILCAVFDNILSFSSPGLFDIGVMYFTSIYVIKPEMFVLFLLQCI